MSPRVLVAVVVPMLVFPGLGAAAEGKLMIYPANGQSDQQLDDDRYACHLQAVERSGFDPSNPPPEIATGPISVKVPDNPKEGATTKGAVAGAVAGAAIGSKDHHRDTVGGAIAGAIVGSAIGSAIEAKGEAKAREQARTQGKQQAQERADARAELERHRAEYVNAIRACLEGRGYVVR